MRYEKQTISEQIVASLRKAIVLQEYQEGDPLVESELSKALGVSRGPIREAFHQLESENLVTKRTNGRTIVNRFTEVDIANLYDSRILIEKHAIATSSAEHIQEAVQKLTACIHDMEQSFELNQRNVSADLRFHQLIVSTANNKTLLQLWKSLKAMFTTLIDITSEVSFSDQREVIELHKEMVEAMANQDLHFAQQLLEKHLIEARNYCIIGVNQVKEMKK
ncbi:GntR family transcriptional regulator [Shouchella sp. JSM 1781072]|uniref:GntR family transcriptional regulator n=1 Tax=Bacillaceae TaxID=186817 RepID=UPI0020D006EC|nr:GntR family transcriptional regulator [Alkalihalobacillus sp. LMS6]UTR07533.1 GntR family transcriptional regulator [Alkalihalobacillus sp. LMS6]